MARGRIGTEQLLIVAVLAIVLLLLFVWMRMQAARGDAAIQERRCQSSIQFHSKIVATSGEKGAPPIDCTPNEVTIDNRDAETAKRQIAQQLVFCWDRWQQGQAQLFKTEGSYCNPCAILRFTQPGAPITGLDAFLRDKDMTGKDLKYQDYLFPYATEGYGLPPDKGRQDFAIDTSEQYAVVFFQDKNHSTQRFIHILKSDPARAAQVVSRIEDYGAKGFAAGGTVSAVLATTLGPVGWGTGIALTVAGTFIGGMVGGASALFSGVPYPEWFSTVQLIPNEGDAYRNLGCSDTFQEGAPKTVNGAENI